jgi:hypothetical protein
VSALRPLPGIPGASYVGNPLPLGFVPEFVEVSPSHDYAVGVEEGTRTVFWIDLRSGIPVAERLSSVGAGVDRVFFSPLGEAAALYYRAAKQVEVLTGLPGEADLRGRVDLASLPGLLTTLAVSDDGKVLAAATSQGDGGSLFVAEPGEEARLLGPLGRATALTFLHSSDDLLVADAGRNEILRIRNASTSAEWTVLASRRDGLDQPVAVAAARDNATAFAVNSGDRTIARMPLGGGPVEFLECSCTPTGLDALAAGSVFRLTSAPSGPLYMLDVRAQNQGLSSEPRVLFIPAKDQSPAGGDAGAVSPRGRVRR